MKTSFTLQPVTARDWEIHIHFSIHGSGDSLYGDGFAFYYAKEKMEFGNKLSLFSKFH